MSAKHKSTDTVISHQAQISGDIKVSGGLLVEGHILGNILADKDSGATVIISEKGSVTGEIHAPVIIINGKVDGNVYAMTQLELAKKAVISGDVHYAMMEMVMGAQVNGRLVHSDNISESSNVIESVFGKSKNKQKEIESAS
ncbi:bactofilin family protein [Marinicellulosiphila megalodicopiae]|uniref:bactofilin family protein n=1 Tax=Marinicellulosiphila megalodicopiae TaxID=2724896 RepID=UPI003BAE90FB